jgi:paraquat-inducible protein B
VARFGLGFDAKSGVLTTPVVIALDPTRFHVSPGTGPADTALTAALRQLVAQGMRARLAQTPPLIGGRTVELAMVPGAARAALVVGGEYPQIPAAEGGGLDAAITKVGNLPLAQIGENLRDITREIKVFVSSPKLEASLDHLDSTLANLDRTVSEARPRVEAMVKSLQNTADELDATARSAGEVIGGSPTGENGNMKSTLDELTQAARAIRSLADYLDRHPEALIKGR